MVLEKEINIYLLNQLDTIEDAIEIAKKENAAETLAFLEKTKRRIERKLYQTPPRIDSVNGDK